MIMIVGNYVLFQYHYDFKYFLDSWNLLLLDFDEFLLDRGINGKELITQLIV